ncbi:MAG: FAD-binding oxidoreductase [Proteobacteria bacterium]|nr:FAD-binding oxidoreductase [Pseudomonadota bacterium]
MMAETKKVVPARIPEEAYKALEDIVGPQWISQDRAVVETYSKYCVDRTGYLRKHMKDPTAIPAAIILPGSTEEVQAIIRVCNRYKVHSIPFTNGQFSINAPPTPNPTLCIHVSRMNRVLEINEENMTATLEAYGDYGQLQAEAMKRGLWNGGCPLATTLCKLSSQMQAVGVWQTDLKYGTISRNIISAKVVLPTGDILKLGSSSVSGVEDFWEYGPGPDLLGLVRGSVGTAGVVTEMTVKLHTWVGGKEMPEPPAGRPSIRTYYEQKYDTVSPPKRHKLLWVEFPDYETEIKALRAIAHSGVGIGLNATGVYNSYYCSQTQELTLKRVKEKFFPPYNLYVILAGITSERQIDYEEKVVRAIISEVGGTFLTEDYKGDVLTALAPWNVDCIRHVTGFRMNRFTYAGSNVPGGSVDDVAWITRESLRFAIDKFGETYITDRGGLDDTPFLYAISPYGRFWLSETDVYPDPMNPQMLQRADALVFCGVTQLFAHKCGPGANGIGVSLEPLTSFFPEHGPNAHLLFRKLRKAWDPYNLYVAGRQVFTEEEYKAYPQAIIDAINQMRGLCGMKPVSKE